MTPPEKTFDFHFPKAGLAVADAFGRQPVRQDRFGNYVRTAADGVNVRTFEFASGRDRGGARPGLSKRLATRVNTEEEWIVQHLATVASTSGGALVSQQSASGRAVYLLAVSRGYIKYALPGDTSWTATINDSGEDPPLNISGVMQSTSLLQKEFFVDGTNYVYYNPPTNQVLLWSATNGGSLPRDSNNNGARLITTWRGRAVLSGLLKDPQNWFMSKQGDPFNLDYSPAATSAVQAVAGNNSRLGLIGDVVTALIPYTDDVLIFGGDHTIYAMRGDPADGGQIDLVSDVTGVAFGEAWCKDPYGTIYFFGSRPSVWRMQGASQPVRISQPIEPLLQGINTGENVIRLVWDDREQSVHLYITYNAEPSSNTHFVWEYRSNSWWKDRFSDDDHNPLCVTAYDGNDPGDRVVLLGCWDGYVRGLDPEADTDDGTPIESYVLVGPILTQELDEMLLKEIQGVLAEGSGDVRYEILAGPTPEAALATVARAAGVFSAGRNTNQPVRVADHAIYVKLSSTSRWAMETVRAKFAGRGKVRRRG